MPSGQTARNVVFGLNLIAVCHNIYLNALANHHTFFQFVGLVGYLRVALHGDGILAFFCRFFVFLFPLISPRVGNFLNSIVS